jgi:hypothetical protein
MLVTLMGTLITNLPNTSGVSAGPWKSCPLYQDLPISIVSAVEIGLVQTVRIRSFFSYAGGYNNSRNRR